MNNIQFNFYGFIVEVTSVNEEILDLLKKDFRYFLTQNKQDKNNLKIDLKLNKQLDSIIPKGLIASKQSINSMTFDDGHIRYNDYYGEVVSKFDYKNESCLVCALTLNRLHEVSYLIILSRQGKWADRNGLHKVHAMSVSKNNKNLILMLPMKGGKTTLFTQFLRNESIGLISDDTPVIDRKGNVKPFPIRFGIEDKEMYQDIVSQISQEYKSVLERKQFGTKILVDLSFYKDRVAKMGSTTILIQGIRHNSDETIVKEINFFQMYKYLVTNLVVGIGLPMVIEYFLESGIKDKIRNFKILISRSIASAALILKSDKKFVVYMGTNIEQNATTIEKLLD